jgi:hypothetical protein
LVTIIIIVKRNTKIIKKETRVFMKLKITRSIKAVNLMTTIGQITAVVKTTTIIATNAGMIRMQKAVINTRKSQDLSYSMTVTMNQMMIYHHVVTRMRLMKTLMKQRVQFSNEPDLLTILDQETTLKTRFTRKRFRGKVKNESEDQGLERSDEDSDTDEDVNESQCQLIVRKRTYVNVVTKEFKKAVIDSGCEVHLATDVKVLDEVLTTYSKNNYPSPLELSTASGSSMKIKATGHINGITKKVHGNPQLQQNLLSGLQLEEEGN